MYAYGGLHFNAVVSRLSRKTKVLLVLQLAEHGTKVTSLSGIEPKLRQTGKNGAFFWLPCLRQLLNRKCLFGNGAKVHWAVLEMAFYGERAVCI